MDNSRTREAFTSYFRFNNARTLSTSVPSELEIHDLQAVSAYVDVTRRYDNLIVVHKACANEELKKALELYGSDNSPEILLEQDIAVESVSQFLQQNGFSHVDSIDFLNMRPAGYVPALPDAKDMRIERWGQEKADDFLELLKTSGLNCAGDVWDNKRRFYCSDTFRCFVASVKGSPCAWATTYIDDNVATLANAYTQQAYRGQGCQTALLHARIQDAMNLGVELLLSDVVPDTASSRNCRSVGFNSYSLREVWSQ